MDTPVVEKSEEQILFAESLLQKYHEMGTFVQKQLKEREDRKDIK